MRMIVVLGLALTLSGCASVGGGMDLMSGGRFEGRKLDAALRTASAFPLGSRENPVRVNMPEGQRAYLSRLRCGDGAAPSYERIGNFGPGPFGSIIDGYRVTCLIGELKERRVFMDMYHPSHVEVAPVPGFAIAPPVAPAPPAS